MADLYSVATKLLDESFNPLDTPNYGLAIILNETTISCCTVDFKRNKFLGLHRFEKIVGDPRENQLSSGPLFLDFFSEVITAIPWLRNPFRITKIAYDGKNTTLVPAQLFDPNEKEQYLNFNFTQVTEGPVFCDHLMPLDAWQVYCVPPAVVEATMEFFPKCKVVHAASLLIESIWINYKNRINTPHIFLHVRKQLFDLMIFNGRQMSYFNTFRFQNPDDVTYYLIFVMEQLNLNPEKIPLVLLGNIEMGNDLSELLLRYVRHVETARRNDSYKYSYILNQLPPHSDFPLFNFFSCGL